MAAPHPTGKVPPPGRKYDLVLLAGGEGRRMGGKDKGLVAFHGQPLAAALLDRFAADAARVVISANRNHSQYQAMADAVCSDLRDGLNGPLAGIEAALKQVTAPACLVLPCDMPHLPAALAQRLLTALGESAVAACVHDGEHLQPLCLALNTASAGHSLKDYLDSGRRSVHGWLEGLPARLCDCSDWPTQSWDNINDPDALTRLEQA